MTDREGDPDAAANARSGREGPDKIPQGIFGDLTGSARPRRPAGPFFVTLEEARA
jgi:hypothetical protein